MKRQARLGIYGELVSGFNYQQVRMPFPGRRARKARRLSLATALVTITILASFSSLLPGIIASIYPASSGLPSSVLADTNPIVDAPRVSLPPGTVNYGVRDSPFYSKAADSSISPSLMKTADRFLYETSFGQYSFNKSYPYIFTLVSRSGMALTRGSWFFVNSTSSRSLSPGNATVMVSTDSQFDVSYSVLSGNLTVGLMEVKVDFYQSARPKLTATFSETPAWNLGGFNVIWSTATVPQWYKINPTATRSTSSVPATTSNTTSQKITSSASTPVSASSVELGRSGDSSSWADSLIIDWSDAAGGTLQTGPTNIGKLPGLGVIFPSNQTVIDPTQVGTSTNSFATGYSTQRKNFYYGGYYFVFYYDGSNIVYSTSLNGLTWTPGFTGSGQLGYGFDVYNSGSSIAMTWLDYSFSWGGPKNLLFQKGSILGGSISWDPVVNVTRLPSLYAGPPSVVVGSDGMSWIGDVMVNSTGSSYVRIFGSNDGVAFTLSTRYPTFTGGDAFEALQLVPMQKGRLMALSAGSWDSNIRWSVLNPIAPSGPTWSPVQLFNAYLPVNTYKWNLISAVGTPDGLVHLLTTPGTTYWRYSDTSGVWSPPAQIDSDARDAYPSIGTDSLGGLQAVWMSPNNPGTSLWYCFKPNNQSSWLGGSMVFGSGSTNATWVSASRIASKQLIVSWTMPPYPYKIMVGTIPLVSGIASSPPSQPWSRLGVTSMLSSAEYVAPGNGLLAAGYTDLSAAGRGGLDLSIRRLNLQPFTALNGGPFNYETSPYSDLGYGWQLNLPWVGQQYLHYSDGQIFPIVWKNYTFTSTGTDIIKTWSFENHASLDFVFQRVNDTSTSTWVTTVTYKLTGKDGSIYNFNNAGLVTSMVDKTGQNQIAFTQGNYAPYYNLHNTLTSITDSIGRVATFAYTPDMTGKLANITYAGQTVKYGYSGSNLASAKDALQRTIGYTYSTQNTWLITRITYPAGGYTNYTYGSASFGTDATNYYVTLQNVYTNTLVRSTSFSYQITDGAVTYTNVTQSDGVFVQGSTNYEFNSRAASMTLTSLDASGIPMKKLRYWNDVNGRVIQQDIFNGNTIVRSSYTLSGYDQWGNQVYSRDALGHESYGSFANSDSQYKFQSPGNLTTSTDGRIFYDDFNIPHNFNIPSSYTNWNNGATGVSTSTTVLSSLLTLRAASSTQGAWQSNWVLARQTFGYPFYAEVQMSLNANPGNGTIDADFELSPQFLISGHNPYQNQDLLRFIISDGPSYSVVKCVAGPCTTAYSSGFVRGGSLSVSWKIILMDSNTLTVYLNSGSGYKPFWSTTTLGLSGAFTPSYAYLSFYNLNTAAYSGSFDYAGLYGSNTVSVNGLQAGQKVELYDSTDVLQSSATVASGQTSVSLNGTQMVFPYGYLKIYEQDGRSLQSISPTPEVWGGSTYSYVQPFRSGGIYRSLAGFPVAPNYLASLYFDDNLPAGAQLMIDGGDSWLLAGQPSVPVASGSVSHVGFTASGEHQHSFQVSTPLETGVPSGYFHIQYVYIPIATPPSEIMLQFLGPSGWDHRAYWGSNSIPWGTDNTASRRYMGPLPAARDSWVELIVKSNDVETQLRNLNGLSYTLYNGGVNWDYSALGGISVGAMIFNGLLAGQYVKLYDANWALKATSNGGWMDLYSAGINVFPFVGYLKVYSATGSLQYTSPLMTDIWGGEMYNYVQPVFTNAFDFGAVASSIHGASLARAQYQNSTSIIEAYAKYDSTANLLQQNQRYNSPSGLQWISTSSTYDGYGNARTVTDARGNTTYYNYDPAYNSAYLTNQTRRDGSIQMVTLYSYNFTTGNTLSTTDPRGFITTYQYDILGRLKTVAYPANLGSTSYNYVDSGNYVDTTSANGWKTRQIYDLLGRQSILEKFLGNTPYSNRTTSYSWQNLVSSQTDQLGNRTSYQYDYLGRLTMTTKPDGNTTRVYYNDILSQIRAMDEYSKNRCNTSDQVGRLVSVVEIADSNCNATPLNGYNYVTGYSYDWAGNLRTLTNAASQLTKYTYDNLNTLTGTTYPDGTSESYAYDSNGNMIRKTNRAGAKALFSYDALNRLKTMTYCGPPITSTSYTYDKNSNVLTLQNENASITYTYDARNRLLTERYQVNPATRTITDLGCSGSGSSWAVQGGISEDYTVSYTYNRDVLSTITYPTVGTPTNIGVGYVYDTLGRVSVVNQTGSSVVFAKFSYFKTDRIRGIQFGNNLVGNYTYDKLQRTASIVLKNGSNNLMSLSYGYNSTGTVASVTGQANNSTVNERYSYDSLRRLTAAVVISQGGTNTVSYQYDNLGNRRTQTNNTVVTNYSYNSANSELTSLLLPATGANSAYSYDSDGNTKAMNITSGSTNRWSYTWNAGGRLLNVTKNGVQQGRYAYDGQARQTESIETGSCTTFYAYYGSETLYKQLYGSYSIDFIYAQGLRIARVDSSSGHPISFSTIQYFHSDALGSIRLITSSGAAASFANGYQPYGRDNGTPFQSSTEKFTGKSWSGSTNLYYYGMRWYDPSAGRFISPDPKPGRMSRPQSLNPYVYVVNSPLNYVDPWGEAECGFWDIGCHAGNVWNAGVNAYNSLSPEQQDILWIAVGIVATVATGGAAAPLVLGVGLATGVGAVGVYAGYSYATGQQMTLHGALQAFSIGFAIGTVGASLAVKAGWLASNAGRAAQLVQKANFAPGELAEHFAWHGAEMGYKSAPEYLSGARSLLLRGFTGKADLYTKGYDFIAVEPGNSGRFAVYAADTGYIRTFFTPERGFGYIADQIFDQGWDLLSLA